MRGNWLEDLNVRVLSDDAPFGNMRLTGNVNLLLDRSAAQLKGASQLNSSREEVAIEDVSTS